MNFVRAHWLFGLNLAVAVFVGGALVTPVLEMAGWQAAADALYAAYHLTCHQWAFRSFFILGGQPVYSIEDLQHAGFDPLTFDGAADLGWKMAICERDIAIYLGALAAGLWYARARPIAPLSLKLYCLLILPMAIDGFTQLFGWRESTWLLRVVTGLLFGIASVWFLYPRFDDALATQRYARESACVAQPPQG